MALLLKIDLQFKASYEFPPPCTARLPGSLDWFEVEGGEDSWDPLSCRSFSAKEPLNIGHFCGK